MGRRESKCYWERFLESDNGIFDNNNTISRLPETVLHHVVSFLPTLEKDQVRFLSRKWRRIAAQSQKKLSLTRRRLDEQELSRILADDFHSVDFLSLTRQNLMPPLDETDAVQVEITSRTRDTVDLVDLADSMLWISPRLKFLNVLLQSLFIARLTLVHGDYSRKQENSCSFCSSGLRTDILADTPSKHNGRTDTMTTSCQVSGQPCQRHHQPIKENKKCQLGAGCFSRLWTDQPEGARGSADQVPRTVTKMMKRVDDFIKSKEDYKSTELPKGESSEKGQGVPTTRKENLDKYCDYHGIKGYHTNDCYQLKSIGRQQGNNNTNGKIINMIQVRGEDLKRKYQRNQEEDWMKMAITFPLIPADDLLDEPLIIEAELEGYLVRRVFVDHGVAVQVMFKHLFDNLPLSFRARLTQTHMELVGFSGEQLILMGKIELNVAFRSEGLCRRTMMKFTVVRESSPYNIILRRTEKGPEKETVKSEKEYAKEEVLVNPAFPEQKDYYPHSKIDLKIEAVMGLPFKCFLDAYKGYHQIQMSEEDEEKTTFYIDQGTYRYTKMPFRLKNARVTYHRLVDSLFQVQLGWNLEAYVGDIVIKSNMKQEMIMDIDETFDNL
nr:reverse transcriptase domain-containing protein [Tanacetum cinerariifolium]